MYKYYKVIHILRIIYLQKNKIFYINLIDLYFVEYEDVVKENCSCEICEYFLKLEAEKNLSRSR